MLDCNLIIAFYFKEIVMLILTLLDCYQIERFDFSLSQEKALKQYIYDENLIVSLCKIMLLLYKNLCWPIYV